MLSQGAVALEDQHFYYIYVANAEGTEYTFTLDLTGCADYRQGRHMMIMQDICSSQRCHTVQHVWLGSGWGQGSG